MYSPASAPKIRQPPTYYPVQPPSQPQPQPQLQPQPSVESLNAMVKFYQNQVALLKEENNTVMYEKKAVESQLKKNQMQVETLEGREIGMAYDLNKMMDEKDALIEQVTKIALNCERAEADKNRMEHKNRKLKQRLRTRKSRQQLIRQKLSQIDPVTGLIAPDISSRPDSVHPPPTLTAPTSSPVQTLSVDRSVVSPSVNPVHPKLKSILKKQSNILSVSVPSIHMDTSEDFQSRVPTEPVATPAAVLSIPATVPTSGSRALTVSEASRLIQNHQQPDRRHKRCHADLLRNDSPIPRMATVSECVVRKRICRGRESNTVSPRTLAETVYSNPFKPASPVLEETSPRPTEASPSPIFSAAVSLASMVSTVSLPVVKIEAKTEAKIEAPSPSSLSASESLPVVKMEPVPSLESPPASPPASPVVKLESPSNHTTSWEKTEAEWKNRYPKQLEKDSSKYTGAFHKVKNYLGEEEFERRFGLNSNPENWKPHTDHLFGLGDYPVIGNRKFKSVEKILGCSRLDAKMWLCEFKIRNDSGNQNMLKNRYWISRSDLMNWISQQENSVSILVNLLENLPEISFQTLRIGKEKFSAVRFLDFEKVSADSVWVYRI